jgi:hypothetical protein
VTQTHNCSSAFDPAILNELPWDVSGGRVSEGERQKATSGAFARFLWHPPHHTTLNFLKRAQLRLWLPRHKCCFRIRALFEVCSYRRCSGALSKRKVHRPSCLSFALHSNGSEAEMITLRKRGPLLSSSLFFVLWDKKRNVACYRYLRVHLGPGTYLVGGMGHPA